MTRNFGSIRANETGWPDGPPTTTSGTLSDGDKGDVAVSGGGAVWTVQSGPFDPPGTAAAAVSAHEAASDPHPVYLAQAEASALYASIGHFHNGIPTVALKGSDQTNIGTSYADVTGTGLPVLAQTVYGFDFILIVDADATTTGIDVAVNGPLSPTAIVYEQVYWTSATARTERCATAYDANTASTASNGAASKLYRVSGILRNGNNGGTLIARAKRENVGSGPNVRAGSYGLLWRLS